MPPAPRRPAPAPRHRARPPGSHPGSRRTSTRSPAHGRAGSPCRHPLEQGAHPVGHVVVGPRRLDDRDGERLAAVGDREVGGAAELLGQRPQDRAGELAEHRLQATGQGQHPEPDVQPAVRVAAGQPVLLEGGHQPVDDGAVDPDLGGQRGDAETGRCRRQGPQHAQTPVEGLRRLGGHGPNLSDVCAVETRPQIPWGPRETCTPPPLQRWGCAGFPGDPGNPAARVSPTGAAPPSRGSCRSGSAAARLWPPRRRGRRSPCGAPRA